MDITRLILDDHDHQRRLFAILDEIPDDDSESLSAVWGRLSTFLEAHAEAEERIFYPALLKVGHGAGEKESAKAETLDAIHDHDEIRDAVRQAAGIEVGSEAWRSAVAEARRANSTHMGEEERQGLADFRRHAAFTLRHELAVRFAAFEASHLEGVVSRNKDPEEYVRAHT